MGRVFVLTGVTGFLGKVVLAELLRRREELELDRVLLLIRPKGPFGAEERFHREVQPSACFGLLPDDWRDAVEVVSASLDRPGLGMEPAAHAALTRRTTHIIHAAASVDFGLPLEAAARSNISTTLNLMETARACPALAALVSVSTAYVTPHRSPDVVIEEALAPLPQPAEEIYAAILEGQVDQAELLARTGHPNTYTLTKSLAEHLAVGNHGDVPLVIVRPSIISASRERPFPGWIDSGSGFAAFVLLLGLGHMRAVIADPEARLDLVPADTVTDAILEAAAHPPARGAPAEIRHVVAGLERSATVRNCWLEIRDYFRVHRVAGRPALWHLGPPGLRFQLADRLHRRLATLGARFGSPGARRVRGQTLARVAQLNHAFPYFTRRSFRFQAADRLGEGFEPQAYVRLVSRGVARHLLRQDETQWVLAGRRQPDHGSDFLWGFGRPGNLVIRLCGWVGPKLFRRILEQVSVDIPSFEAGRRAAPPGSPVVIIPTHRSFLDFVLFTYLCFARPDLGIALPHVAAATEFGGIPIIGRLLRLVNAFYIPRGTARENKELPARVAAMVHQGKTLEFFIEGQRSRTREFLSPKRGLLRCLQATGRSFTLLPVAIAYDRVPEELTFEKELAGIPKHRMRLRGLVTWFREVGRGEIDLGRIHMACGEPVALDPERGLPEVTREVMTSLERAMVCTTYHLRAWLEAHPIEGVDPGWLRAAIEQRGGRVLDSEFQPAVPSSPRMAATLQYQFAHHFRGETAADGPLHHLLEALFGPASPAAGRTVRESVA